MRHELSCTLGGEVDRDDGVVAGIDAGAPRNSGLVAGLDLLSELLIDNDPYRELGSGPHGAALLGSGQGWDPHWELSLYPF